MIFNLGDAQYIALALQPPYSNILLHSFKTIYLLGTVLCCFDFKVREAQSIDLMVGLDDLQGAGGTHVETSLLTTRQCGKRLTCPYASICTPIWKGGGGGR